MFWTHTASYSFTSGHQMASFPGMEISWLTLSVRTFDLNSQTSWFRTKNTPQNTCILQNGEISNMVPTVLITVSWYAGVASGAKGVRNTADLARGSFWHSWAVTFWDMLNHRLLRPVWSTPSKSYLNLQTAFPWVPGTQFKLKILLQNLQSMKNASLYCVLASHLSGRWEAYKVYFTILPQNHFQEDKFPIWPHSNTILISNFCWDHIFQRLLIGSLGICLHLCLVSHFSAVERNGVG